MHSIYQWIWVSGAVLMLIMSGGPLIWAGDAVPPSSTTSSSQCRAIQQETDRLRCYDTAVGQPTDHKKEAPLDVVKLPDLPPTPLAELWELEPDTKHKLFSIRPYKQVYLLPVRYTTNVNNQPSSPTEGTVPKSLGYINTEVKFQLSAKMKMLEGLFKDHLDVWIGYTQLSFFQMYSKSISSPFRETNYEPEIIFTIHTDYDVFGLRGRFVNLGIVHQSNGRQDPLSRSWNRIYAQFGFERDGFALLVRPWYRIKEDWSVDNNPDIVQFLGHGDVVAVYKWGGHTFSLLLRSNLDFWNLHGAAQIDWSFPLYRQLKGYVQVFTGYGESLIDYNHSQTTIGAGFLLLDWM